MNSEEKILAILEKHGEMLEKHSEMLEKQGALLEKQGALLEKQGAILEKHSGMLERLEQDVTGIKLRLDLDIEKKLDLLAEGHETLMGMMSPKSRVEALEDEMAFMKSVVKVLSQEVAELKEAQ